MIHLLVQIPLLAILSLPAAQMISAEESLKIVHSAMATAVDSGNLDAVSAVVHPEAIGFFRDAELPVFLGPEVGIRDLLSKLLAELQGLSSVSYDTEYRVFGDTGVICDRFLMQKGGRATKSSRPTRATYIYSRSNGTWLLTAWHNSAVPLR